MLISCSVVSCCQFQLFHAFLSTFANRRGKAGQVIPTPISSARAYWILLDSFRFGYTPLDFYWNPMIPLVFYWPGKQSVSRRQLNGGNGCFFSAAQKALGPFSWIWVPFGSLFLFNVSLFTASFSMAWHHVTRFSASLHTPSIVQRPWDLYIFL